MSTTSMPPTTTQHPVSDSGRRDQRGVALAIVLCAQLMIILDMTVVNIALPSIARGLHFSAPSLSWVLNAYNIVFAAFLVAAGCTGLGALASFVRDRPDVQVGEIVGIRVLDHVIVGDDGFCSMADGGRW